MITLAIDTCLDACSVALFDCAEGPVLGGRHEPMARGHAEHLLPFADEVMAMAGLSPAEIGKVIVTRGPGTFTGVRVGLSAARALAIGSRVEVGAISSLHALALCAVGGGGRELPIAAVIDARRDELYVATFSCEGKPLTPPAIISASAGADSLPEERYQAVGSGAATLAASDGRFQVAPPLALPDARTWGPRAAGLPEFLEEPVPLYLRKPDAKPPSADAQVSLAPG